jgi:filamentous hemagglutinin family protein
MGTTVSQTGTTYNIGGGTIRGTNQFQSFGLFSVGTGDTASFNGPPVISNIIGRVTGGQLSNIDGRLRSTITGANLYLLNPYGVLFGKNASLSVSGSFHVSTADYLRFSDGARFYANLSNNSTLTSAPIAAFGFLSNAPAAITIQESLLQVPRYKTLSVIGGDINITGGPSGYLYAPSGRINLASVKSSGEVVPNVGGAPDLGVESFSQLGAINLSNLAYVSVESSAGNGTIVIRGGRISVDNSYIIANTLGSANGASVGIDIKVREDFTANNGLIQAGTSSAGRSGDVLVTAGSLDMKNLSKIEAISMGAGNGGNVKVDTGSLNMTEGSQIRTNIWSSGNGGNVTITADKIFLSGANAVSQPTSLHATTNDSSTGHGGDVRLTTGRLEVRDGAQINTNIWGYGNGGVVEVNAESVLLTGWNALNVPAGIFSRPYAFGNAGGVRLKTGSLEVRDGAQISTSVYGLGKGGDLEVTADSILLTPVKESGVNSGLSTGLFARGLYGDGGNIRIKTGSLEVMDGASISSSSKSKGAGGNIEVTADFISLSGVNQYGNRSGIYSQSDGQSAIGAAGDVRITTGSLEVKDGAEITVAALGPGNAGNLEVNAQSVLITGISPSGLSSRLSSNTYTSAKGGNIQITTDNLEVKDGAHIENTAFSSGNGGTIEVTAERVLVSGVSEGKAARITSQVIPGSSGKGGDVQITTNTLEVKDGGEIAISTWGPGNSGALSIAAKNITLDGGSHPELGVGLYASTYGAGNAGMIQINTKTLEMKGGAQIASTTEGSGNSGSIEINADHVALSGVTDTKIRTGIFCATASSGRGGDIKITAGGVDVSDGADIDSGASGSGDAGRIIITAGSLNLSNGAFINGSTIDKGTGGDIDINGGLVQLINNASISADSSGTGNAGNININTWSLLMRNSSIITEAKQADGGNIHIHAGYMVNLIDSVISASVGGGPDTVGGNITIDPRYVILNDSQIIANAYEGRGGNIRIVADVFLASPESVVDASSALGIDGTVDIRAPITNISGTLAPMQGNFLSTEALLRDRCIARIRGERISSFVVSGRDGLPIRPGNVLPSPIY